MIVIVAADEVASAACINRYIVQKDRAKYVLTVLTGRISYPEAYELAQAVNNHTAPPPEWVDDKGKTIARHFGEMKVIRPMPVSCDDKSSGVVLTLTFLVTRPPSGRIHIKFSANTTVALDEQEK